MTTANRTNEPTPEQVEVAAVASINSHRSRAGLPTLATLDGVPNADKWRDDARAALVAAQGAAPQAPVLNPDDMSVMNGYLVLSVNEHTCGTGPDGHYGAHEPGCGYEPLVNLAEIPGYPADAAAAMDRVNRLHQMVLRGNSMLGEELEAWCVHCNIPYPCHTMQALAPVLPSSGVDEDALAEVIAKSRGFGNGWTQIPPLTRGAYREIARAVVEWLKGSDVVLECDECGRFMSEPAEVLPIRDAVHPYTADYYYLCAHCVAERG